MTFVTTLGYRGLDGRRLEHRAVAERVLGKPLPPGAEIHHVNESKLDNRPENLVICQDHAYHALLHSRLAALRACGHADWRACGYCGRYDAPRNLYQRGATSRHRECKRMYQQQQRATKRAAEQEATT